MNNLKLSIIIAVYFITSIFNMNFTFAEMKCDFNQSLNEYIIKFKEGADCSNINIPSNIYSEKIHPNMEYLKTYDKSSCEYIETELANDPRVEYVQQNNKLSIMSVVNDVYYNQQWGLVNSGQSYSNKGIEGIDINFKKFIENFDFESSEEITVALVDTAVDIFHEDLKGNIFVNEKEILGNGLDDDGNGFVDDINGWDFLNNDNSVWDSVSSDVHGTHLAGIIGASLNEIGICGVFPKIKILPIKIMDHLRGADTVTAIKAIEYAKQLGVKIVNCSWGSIIYDQALFDCMKDSDMLFICAAGNIASNSNETPIFPACFPLDNIISVASINNQGMLSDFSCFGQNITLAAPGENIFSTLPGNRYGYKSGTSMATAFVTGVACATYSQHLDQNAIYIADKIKNGVFQLDSLENKVNTSGIVDILSSVNSENYSRLFHNEIKAFQSHHEFILQWDEDVDALAYELEINRDEVLSVSETVYAIDKFSNKNINIIRVRSVYFDNDYITMSRWSKAKIISKINNTEIPSPTPTSVILHTPTPTIITKTPTKNSTENSLNKTKSGKTTNIVKSTPTPTATHGIFLPIVTPSILPKATQEPLVLDEQSKDEFPDEIFKEIEAHWAKHAILNLIKKGILTGYEDNKIKPDKKITRAEMVVLLMKAKGIVPQLESKIELDFEDAAEIPKWAEGYIQEAVQHKIITGYPDHTVKANKEISRAEAVVMLMKAFSDQPSTDNLKDFKDYGDIPNWAIGYLSLAYANNIIIGYHDNTIRANNSITRAEVITMLAKCLDF